MQRLSADGTELAGRPRRLIKQDLEWEGTLVEAPFVVGARRHLHLFYSANAYASAATRWATRPPTPAGPFTKDDDPPGQQRRRRRTRSLLAVRRDDRVWMVYHAWAPDAVGSEVPGRTMWLSEITFDGRSVTVEPPRTDYPTRP